MKNGTNLYSKTVSIFLKTLHLSFYLLTFIVSTLFLVIKILRKTEKYKDGRNGIVFVKQERSYLEAVGRKQLFQCLVSKEEKNKKIIWKGTLGITFKQRGILATIGKQ